MVCFYLKSHPTLNLCYQYRLFNISHWSTPIFPPLMAYQSYLFTLVTYNELSGQRQNNQKAYPLDTTQPHLNHTDLSTPTANLLVSGETSSFFTDTGVDDIKGNNDAF